MAVIRSVYSQPTGIVFAGRNGLDFVDLRSAVIRIPEVSRRIRQAQEILDGLQLESLDLMGRITGDNDVFFKNIKIKSLLSAIVQVGLYDRMLRTQRAPDALVGNGNGDSALLVCAGQISFEQMVRNSPALLTLQPKEKLDSAATPGAALPATISLLPGLSVPLQPTHFGSGAEAVSEMEGLLPSLAGLGLTEFRAFMRAEDGGMVEISQPAMDLKRMIVDVVENHGVTRFISVGPSSAIPYADYESIAEIAGADEVTIIDSIDLDPMLGWFWRELRPALSMAQ